jgi:hydroxysqualene synthase
MSRAADLASGKGQRDENFPVASRLIASRHRAIILAFYRFARAADDVADHGGASVDEKHRLLDEMRLAVLGESQASPEAVALRAAIAERGLDPQHALDLLKAFRRDVTKLRYRDWDDLMEYCRFSANPVGRFVLDVHGESRALWPVNDALCSALQVINHLQDCARDYRNLDRVYIPADAFAAEGTDPAALAQSRASPALKRVIAGLAARTGELLQRSGAFSAQIRDRRLACEVGVIQALAEDLNRTLMHRDPLSQRVHHSKPRALGIAFLVVLRHLLRRHRGSSAVAVADQHS